jgi:phage shock protein C
MSNMGKKLFRTENPRMFFGVCGGISVYLDMNVSLVRILFIMLHFFGIPMILIYILLILFLKSEYV